MRFEIYILIESQWNLNLPAASYLPLLLPILIESQWNLNKITNLSTGEFIHINRITVEFKLHLLSQLVLLPLPY